MGKKYNNLTYIIPRFNPWLFKISVSAILGWHDRMLLHGFVCLMKIHFLVFVLTRILVKTLSRKFYVLYAKSFGDSANGRYFLRFRDGSKNMFVNTNKGNCLFIFLITLLKHLLMGWKFHWNIKTLKYWNIEIKRLFHFKAYWHISCRLIKCFLTSVLFQK